MRMVVMALGFALSLSAGAFGQLGERPAVERHLDQSEIDSGSIPLDELIELGQVLFDARFNKLDGQGRPATTGGGAPRDPDEPDFIRTSGPDSNSCVGCHAQPRSGGAGDFVANVFVLAQTLDPVTESIDANFSNERNTLGMMGAGPVEMLAREMTSELIAIREAARAEAVASGESITRDLMAKGVSFGTITVLSDGKVDPSGVEGVDWDLIIKPFHQKGAVVSLREFTNNAMNHHHGMQSTERFGEGTDPDGDGVVDELTVGDITAATLYQATLNTPGRMIPKEYKEECEEGEALFAQIGCTACHIPSFTLDSRVFTEPSPFNPTGNLNAADVEMIYTFDMTAEGPEPRIEAVEGGGAVISPFTDLKRHDLNDDELSFFANEQVPQGKLNGFAPATDFTIEPAVRPTDQFLTRKLWDVGNTGPYGHRGDLTTITDAIYFHGGEGRVSRDAFFELEENDQAKIVEFLKSLQVVPDGSPLVTIVGEEPAETPGGGGALCGATGGLPFLMTLAWVPVLKGVRRRRAAIV